jgi:glycosyltransferase involved in cell wall biosynthesis
MLLTIALLTKNSEDTVRFALRSIYRQGIPDNVTFELIVVDGYSKDNTLKIVAEEIQKLRKRFPNQFIRYIILQERVGVSYARNLALKEARGDWILWIDSDIVLAQDYILEATKEIETIGYENIAVLYPQRVISVPRKRNLASRLILCYDRVLAYQSSNNFLAISKKSLSERLKGPIQRVLPYTAMQGTFCNTEALRKVGGFNPYLIAAEDVDVFLKLNSNGYKMRPFNSTLYCFSRDSLRAWFRQAMTWEYGKIVMYALNNVSNATKFGIEDLVMKSRNSRNIINHIAFLIVISINVLHLCNPLIAFLIPLVYIYRRLGFFTGYLHACKQREAINRLILLKKVNVDAEA